MQQVRDVLKWLGPLGIVVILGFVAAYFVMGPPPPKSVTIAGGSAGGAYALTAEGLADSLEAEDVSATVLSTAGSIDNVRRLISGEAEIGIVQTGLMEDGSGEGLRSIGAVFYEPLWVFVRGEAELNDLRDLAGMNVAAGAEGSGSRALVDLLLGEVGLGAGDLTISALGGADGARALKRGEVDALVAVSGASAEWIHDLVADPAIQLVSLDRAPAFTRRHPYLDTVTLYAGVIDPAAGLPRRDIQMLAPAAEIVVREDLHPAIQSLLIEAAFARYSSGSIFAAPGAFPTPDLADVELSDEARRYYKDGPTFLRRLFPFDVANFLERAWVLAIPLLTLAYPLVKAAPPVYRWRIRRKIYVWYSDLRDLEREARAAKTKEERAEVRQKLAELQAETGEVEVPLSYNDNLYHLRNHIRFVSGLVDGLPEPKA